MMLSVLIIAYVVALVTTAIFFYGLREIIKGPIPKKIALESNNAPFFSPREKILMFGWEFPPFNSGGLGVACMGIVQALVRRNSPVIFVLPKQFPLSIPGVSLLYQRDDTLTMIAINSVLSPYLTSDSYSANRESAFTGLYGSSLLDEVRRYGSFGSKVARQESYDVIYAHDWLSFPAGMQAKEVSGKPLVVHIHATEFDRSGSGLINQDVYNIERSGMEYADKVITVSEMTKAIIVERYGIPSSKISVVYNGIDEVTAPHKESSSGVLKLQGIKDAGYSIVLFMGRITLQKGPDYFLQAAKKVLAVRPKTFFIMAGSGDMEQRMIEEAAYLGISQQFLFPGFLRGNDQYEAFKNADLFVMPSVSEPFGIAALEAMRAGVPVLLSKQSGISEVTPSSHFVDFWDTTKMASYIGELLDNPLLRSYLVERGYIESAALSWDRAAESIQNIVTDVLHTDATNQKT